MHKRETFEKQQKMINKKLRKEISKQKVQNDSLGLDKIEQKEARQYIFKYFLMEWRMILISQAIILLQTYIHIREPFLTQDFIEVAISGQTEMLIDLVKVYIYQSAFLILSEPVLEILVSQYKTRLQIRIQRDIFEQILSKDILFFEQTKYTQIQKVAISGSNAIIDLACGEKLFTQIKNIFKASGHCYFLFYKSFLISSILLSFTIARGIWTHYSFKWQLNLSKENFTDQIEKENTFLDAIQNVMTVKAFGREKKEIHQYEEKLQQQVDSQKKLDYLNQGINIVSVILNKLQRIIVLYYGSLYFLQNKEQAKISTLTTLLQYSYSFTQVYNSIRELVGFNELAVHLTIEQVIQLVKLDSNQGICEEIYVDSTNFHQELINGSQKEIEENAKENYQFENSIEFSADRDTSTSTIHSLVKINSNGKEHHSDNNFNNYNNNNHANNTDNTNGYETPKNNNNNYFNSLPAKPLTNGNSKQLHGNISFQNVNFKYIQSNEENVLKNINFDIKEGEFIAFAGMSGSGKSTVIKLIERFYDVNDGCILIDGKNIKDLSLGLVRSSIGLVSQEPSLFDTTILKNIVYGVDKYDNETIQKVCDISGVSEFVNDKERFPEGLSTLVGSRGILLSGGQKQRIAIARALIKKPKILIFDEATSSLDADSEHQVKQFIDQLKGGMTIITVAHRLSTIVNCDRIYVMNKGEIIEQGSHFQLLELNGQYKQLINRQLHQDYSPEQKKDKSKKKLNGKY